MMNFRIISIFPKFSMLLLLWCALACTSSQNTKEGIIREGQSPFAFDTKKIMTFEIAKADPKTGDAWSAQFDRNPDGIWEVASGPGGGHLIDRKAHSQLIDHLLDTLRTLRVTHLAPKGPPESFELIPPRFALRWGGHELRLGSGQFASIGSTVYEVEGAALKMLDYIDSFQSLREQTLLSPITSDDIDEVELSQGGKKYFYAQREGTVWTDVHHKPVKPDMSFFLDQLTHARIQEFVDQPETSAQLAASVRKNPLVQITLKDRLGHATQAYWKWETMEGTKKLFSTSSLRPSAVFRIFDGAVRFFEPFKKHGTS